MVSKYAMCIFLDQPDDILLKTPISKICFYFDGQYAIFDNTNYFIIVNKVTFAIVNARQLQGSHLTSNSLQLLDAGCNWWATGDEDRHLLYAYCPAGTGKTIVATSDGRLVADTAKSCFMIRNDATHAFAKQTNVVKPVMHVYGNGHIVILTDEGLAFYYTDDIKTSTGTMVKPRSAIAVVDASQCIQAFDLYYDDGGVVYVVLTAKGMIQYVKF